jgi:hypothetical protein
VTEAQRLKEILIHNVRAGAHNRIDHVMADQVREHLLQPCADQRAGQAENHRAAIVAQHAVVDVRRPMQIAGAVSHMPHAFHERHHVMSCNVVVLDSFLKKLLPCRHDHHDHPVEIISVLPGSRLRSIAKTQASAK